MVRLNVEQKKAIEHIDGPLLVVAGAGTGKTHVITQRIAKLIADGHARPDEILALTFTDKAAEEMAYRVSEILDKFVVDVNISTFNAFGAELIKEYSTEIGYGNDTELLSEKQQIIFLSQHLEEFELDYYAPVSFPHRFAPELIRYFSALRNEMIDENRYQAYAKTLAQSATTDAEKLEAKKQSELASAYQKYRELLFSENFIHFDDQLLQPIYLFQQKPNVLKQVQSRYKYILVDEFQDTNGAQAELLRLIAGNGNIMAVGDDDQSIYQFRGASVRNILEFKDTYSKSKQIALVQNYRSSQQILNASYALIQHNNPERLESKYQIDKQLVAQFEGGAPRIESFDSLENEAEWIARDIKSLLKKNPKATVSVLLRKNSQARILSDYFRLHDISFEQAGDQESLFEQPVVKWLISLLEALHDVRHSNALYKALLYDYISCDGALLQECASEARRKHIPIEDLIRERAEKLGVAELIRLIDSLRQQMGKETVGRIAYLLIEGVGLLSTLKEGEPGDIERALNIATMNQFFQFLLQFERVARDARVDGFVEELPLLLARNESLKQPRPEAIERQGVVQLMSVHRSKGLEFDAVYLFDMTQQTFPARRQSRGLEIPPELLGLESEDIAAEHIREERRLMYVAMTRAKKHLTMTYSFDHGGKRMHKPSQFLAEAFDVESLEVRKPKLANSTSQIDMFAHTTPNKIGYDKLVLSVGQISNFDRSPEEYFERHVLSMPEEPSGALQYGTLLHGAIEFYYRELRHRPVKVSELEDFIRGQWPDEGFISSEHSDRSLGKALVTMQNFYKRAQAEKRQPRYVEQPFQLEFEDIQVLVKGRYDAVFVEDASVEIRDFKTGGSSLSDTEHAQKRAKDSLQLRIYALAWREQHGDAPQSLTLDFIDRGLVGTVEFSSRILTNTEQKIRDIATEIRRRWYS